MYFIYSACDAKCANCEAGADTDCNANQAGTKVCASTKFVKDNTVTKFACVDGEFVIIASLSHTAKCMSLYSFYVRCLHCIFFIL